MTEAQALELIALVKAVLYVQVSSLLSVGFFVIVYAVRRLFTR